MHKIGTKLRDLPLLQGAVPQYQTSDMAVGSKEYPMGRLLALDSDGNYLLGCHGSGAEIYKVYNCNRMTFIAFEGSIL